MGWECGDRRHHGKSPKPATNLLLGWVIPFFFLHAGPVVKFPRGKCLVAAMLAWNHSVLGGFHRPCSFIHSLWFCRPLVWGSWVALWSACLGGQPHLLWLGSPGENYSLSPLIIFPLPPVGWFSLGLVVPRVSVLSFPIVAHFAPIRGFSFCLTIMALLVLAYRVRIHHHSSSKN